MFHVVDDDNDEKAGTNIVDKDDDVEKHVSSSSSSSLSSSHPAVNDSAAATTMTSIPNTAAASSFPSLSPLPDNNTLDNANMNTTTNNDDDAALAQALSAMESVQAWYTIETLTQVFGFTVEASSQAVEAVGTDVTNCYNYILDMGLGQDTGGAIYPTDHCPHVETQSSLVSSWNDDNNNNNMDSNPILKNPFLFQIPCTYNTTSRSKQSSKGNLKGDTTDQGTCPLGENWLCCECGGIFCSRYINGHGLDHWKDTQTMQIEQNSASKDEANSNNDAETDDKMAAGHCVAISLADLSVWCHMCNAYVKHDSLSSLLTHLEKLKFPNDDDIVKTTDTGGGGDGDGETTTGME